LIDGALQGRALATRSSGSATCSTCSPSRRATLPDGWFESEAVKAAFGFDAVVGNYASPDTPGSAYVLLHHVFGEVNGKKGAWGHAVGGMGGITQIMAKACEEAGVEISLKPGRACWSMAARSSACAGRRRGRSRPSRNRQRRAEAALSSSMSQPMPI
jgi:hypothetical protein